MIVVRTAALALSAAGSLGFAGPAKATPFSDDFTALCSGDLADVSKIKDQARARGYVLDERTTPHRLGRSWLVPGKPALFFSKTQDKSVWLFSVRTVLPPLMDAPRSEKTECLLIANVGGAATLEFARAFARADPVLVREDGASFAWRETPGGRVTLPNVNPAVFANAVRAGGLQTMTISDYRRQTFLARATYRLSPGGQDVRLVQAYFVDDVYPDRAWTEKIPGGASVDCKVSAAYRLNDCKITAENPAGHGFGDAVLSAAGAYDAKRARKKPGQTVTIRRRFAPDRQLDLYNAYPPRALSLEVEAAAGVICLVAEYGRLTDCKLETLLSSATGDFGFGRAAVEQAKYMRVRIGADGGMARVGERVQVPVAFIMPD